MSKKIISTQNAPAAVGAYSQAVKVADTIYISGQIPLQPDSGKLVSDNFIEQAKQVFENLSAIARAADSSLDKAVKLTVYLTDLNHFSELNQIMAEFIQEPYPARAAVEVSALPKGAQIEIDATLFVG
ncbi:MAG: RidA family protein [Acidiferrobacterales bacterium]|nr:RidA family protein [Acidiferrobacterales bacterium]